MSNLLPSAEAEECNSLPHEKTVMEALPDRTVRLGSLEVHRVLPVRGRRLIGPWCFFDRFGPVTFAEEKPMDVAPHPHIGLQTVTWPLEGEIVHRDTLGYAQRIRPGQLNLMTAGRGIAHSEESPADRPQRLHGAQLWIALPDAERNCEPAFNHYPELPVVERDGMKITVLLGAALGERSPGRIHTPLVGLDLVAPDKAATSMPLEAGFEYGALVLEGSAWAEGEALEVGTFLYLGYGRTALLLRTPASARILVIGGEPFGEEVLLWWNFVARSRAEIEAARSDWESGRRFAAVQGYPGARLVAPQLPWAA
jgi:quercetin 2,3-dioxygenase